jgi:hypothetical protein
METREKKWVRTIFNWAIGNTLWGYFIRVISFLGSLFATRWASIQPGFSYRLGKINFPFWIAIGTMFIGFFVIIWAIVSLLFRLYKQLKQNSINGIKPRCKFRKDGSEVYLDVKNGEWFFDYTRIRLCCHFAYNYDAVVDPLEWLNDSNKNGETFIEKRKSKIIHFATINYPEQAYSLHLLGKDLSFPFQNDRSIEFSIQGFTSAPTGSSKKNINGILLVIESIYRGEMNFEIGVQH